MAEDKIELNLNVRPDGYGFIYGQMSRGEEFHQVNILPPKGEWDGDYELEGYEPHATDFIIYIDGDEFARVSRRDQIDQTLKLKFNP